MRFRKPLDYVPVPEPAIKSELYRDCVSVSWRPDLGHRWQRIKDGFTSTDEAWDWVARQGGKYAKGMFMVVNNPERIAA